MPKSDNITKEEETKHKKEKQSIIENKTSEEGQGDVEDLTEQLIMD